MSFKFKSIVFLFTVITIAGLIKIPQTSADWWTRPTGELIREDRPVVPRDDTPTVAPTQSVQPTTSPGTGGPSDPTSTPGSQSNSVDDPCASGKSYVGPYCGWSPSADQSGNSGGGSSSSQSVSGIGGPQVLGLSYTASAPVSAGWSDIILLSGVLCILLYVKSKLTITISR